MSESTVYYVVELVGQSHEQHRADLTNEDVVTVPVVGGPFDTHGEAVDDCPDEEHYAIVPTPVSRDPPNEPPCAYLFGNGNAMFFDELGEQIVEYQKDGLAGIHAFNESFPEAPIFWAIWGDRPIDHGISEIHENLFDYIKQPEEVNDG